MLESLRLERRQPGLPAAIGCRLPAGDTGGEEIPAGV